MECIIYYDTITDKSLYRKCINDHHFIFNGAYMKDDCPYCQCKLDENIYVNSNTCKYRACSNNHYFVYEGKFNQVQCDYCDVMLNIDMKVHQQST